MQRKDDKAIRLTDYKPSAYLIDKTDIHFDLDEDNTIVNTTLSIRKNPEVKSGSKKLILNGDNLSLDSIAINGKPLSPNQYKVTSSNLTINNVPKAFKLKIQTHLNPKTNKSLEGLYVTKGVLCTLCEAESFRKLTFFLDRPDVMSSFKTTLVGDQKKYPTLLSNGVLTSKGKFKNGKHWTTWNDVIKKPSYLFVLVGGKFDIAEDKYVTKSGREIKLQIYVEKGKKDQCGLALDMLKKAMRWDEDTYGREYDLNTYKIVAVNDFDASADENTGINIFKENCVLGTPANTEEHSLTWIQSTVPHEFFHHWSGNRVTIRDWFQVSLKEGLTTFREQSFNEDTFSKSQRLNSVDSVQYQFRSDDYPVQPASFTKYSDFQSNAVSSIYSKGAEIFRMLETYLGIKTFRKATATYFDRYKGKAATFENYLQVLEELSNKDLSQFLLWFREPGTPVLQITDQYDEQTKTYKLKVNQISLPMSQDMTSLLKITEADFAKNKPLPIPIKLKLFDEKGGVIPLRLDDEKTEKEKILFLTENKAEYTFKNVRSKPIPSLLRGFSAPVVLEYEQAAEDLPILLKHDTDVYVKHRAGKKYLSQILLEMINDYHDNGSCKTPGQFIETFRSLLKNKRIDQKLLSALLDVPSEIALVKTRDLDAIHHAREKLLTDMATELQAEFAYLLEKTATDDKADLVKDPGLRTTLGKRQLHNACLFYLSLNNDSEIRQLLVKRFNDTLAVNLSDNIAALQNLVDQGGKVAKTALDKFYDRWKDDEEKVNIWLQAQASSRSSDTVANLRKLLDDERFDINKPRQAFTLMYTFLANIAKCYGETEESYAFIAELYKRLQKVKSELAKELITILNGWKSLLEDDRKLYFDQYLEDIVSQKHVRFNSDTKQNEDISDEADATETLLAAIDDPVDEVAELAAEAAEAAANQVESDEEESVAEEDTEEEEVSEAEEVTEEEIALEEKEAEKKLLREALEVQPQDESVESSEEEDDEVEDDEEDESDFEDKQEVLKAKNSKPITDPMPASKDDRDLGAKMTLRTRDYFSANKLGLGKDHFNLKNKSNRQIHLLLAKQGIFKNKPALLEKSSDNSCVSSHVDYQKFAEGLLRK